MRHCPACGQLDDFDHPDNCRRERVFRRVRASLARLHDAFALAAVAGCVALLIIWTGF